MPRKDGERGFVMQWQRWMASAGLVLCVLGCSRDPHSPAGFVLPQGDATQGLTVLVRLQCHTCHRVRTHAELPEPTAQPPVPIVLGDSEGHTWTDGELVTAIIHPSYRITSRYAPELVRSGELSRMGDFSETMTVQELVDIVALLQSLHQSDRPDKLVPAWRTSPLDS
jgi:hypothetical protein